MTSPSKRKTRRNVEVRVGGILQTSRPSQRAGKEYSAGEKGKKDKLI